jgi:predicted dithiol-disulfide oxidoreductase (DUF899 family)
MNVGTEQEWTARKELLAAERELNLMFGEDWAVACQGCSSLADGLDGAVAHLNDRDITLLCMSHAPLERIVAYKSRRGWTFPYVSAHGGDFLFDYGYAFRREEMSVSVSAGWSVFAMRDGAVYNTYRVYPHSRLITPLFSGLLELLPNRE